MEGIKSLTREINQVEEELQSLLNEIGTVEEDLKPVIGDEIREKQFELNAIMKEREKLIKETYLSC